MLDEFISQTETSGYIVSTKYYDALTKNAKENIAELKKQRDAMTAEMNAALDSGAIEKNSEAYFEMVGQIDDVTLSIEQLNTQLLEYEKTMRELDWSVFDLIQERISEITEEADFLIELMSNKKLYDDKGQLTDEGQASMGLHAVNYNTYMNQADQYAAEAKKLDAEIAKDPYNQDLINRRKELIELQRESILSAEDEKNAIRDMVEEGINLELDALQELIDKRNEALDTSKDLYDYQQKIAEQTKEIADLEKQLGAYAGDDSEEAKATIQQLKVDLAESKQDLEESEYDRYISDQQALLDELYLEYETILNARLDNLDALVMQQIDYINQNAANIQQTLVDQTTAVGTQLSTAISQIWDTTNVNANGDKIKNVIEFYGKDFGSKLTTVNTTINGITAKVQEMITKLDALAVKKTQAASSSSAAKPKPSTPSNPKPSNPPKPANNGGDGVPRVGDKVKFVSGQYYYDSYGTRPAGYHNRGGYVYITHTNTKAPYAYHISTGSKLGNGDLGWLKLDQLSGYASGNKKLNGDEYAWTQENGAEMIVRPSDGAILTPLAKNDSVLTSAASRNIWDMANDPANFIKESLGISVNGDVSGNTAPTVNQTIENVTFSMPNVKNYDQMIRTMQKDKNFERLVNAMSIDQLAGKSSLSKGKAVKR